MIPVAASPYPIVMAHRGGAHEASENSMAAFRRLADLGIRYVETDVQLTSDGVVVVCHDEELDRSYGGEGPILEHTYEEILGLRDAEGNQMPRLADVLGEFPDLYLNVDAKTDQVAEPMLEVLQEYEALDRTMIASFSEKRLERIRQIAGPAVSTSLGVSAVVRLMMAAETVSNPETWHVPGPRHHARAVQVPEKTRGIRVVTPRFVATAHTAGLAVHVWTVNDPDKMVELVDMGVDGLITDRPSMAKELLADMGLWDPEVG